jgi:hypothetical protein
MAKLESVFQKRALKRLRREQDLYVFTKEALAIRGIPDLIGCYKGLFFALELKKDISSTRATTGRIVLQKYVIGLINKAGGFARISCPETFEQDLADLILKAHLRLTSEPSSL